MFVYVINREDYVLICMWLAIECVTIIIYTMQMAGRDLLDDTIDAKHRARKGESGKQPDVLRTRTPGANWRLHPAWVDRYVKPYIEL